jgi:hypothetical protein
VKLNQPLRLAGPNGVTYEATDTYDVSGLVVSRARYWFGEQAAYCPVDLAIAWGPLTTTEKLSAVRYSQSNRWYWFRHNGTNGVDNPMIIRYSANNHMIPATGDKTVRRLLLGVRRGDRVRIRGYLVNVTDSKGRTLRTSRERDDTGAGSCEIIFVTDVEKLP